MFDCCGWAHSSSLQAEGGARPTRGHTKSASISSGSRGGGGSGAPADHALLGGVDHPAQATVRNSLLVTAADPLRQRYSLSYTPNPLFFYFLLLLLPYHFFFFFFFSRRPHNQFFFHQ